MHWSQLTSELSHYIEKCVKAPKRAPAASSTPLSALSQSSLLLGDGQKVGGLRTSQNVCIVCALRVSVCESRSSVAAERRWAAECQCVFIQISFFLVYIRCEFLCLEGRPHCVCVCVCGRQITGESQRALAHAAPGLSVPRSPLPASPLSSSAPLILFHLRSPVRSLSAAGAEDKRAALGCGGVHAYVRMRLQSRNASFARLLFELRWAPFKRAWF